VSVPRCHNAAQAAPVSRAPRLTVHGNTGTRSPVMQRGAQGRRPLCRQPPTRIQQSSTSPTLHGTRRCCRNLAYRTRLRRHGRGVSRIDEPDGKLEPRGVGQRNLRSPVESIHVPAPEWVRPASDVRGGQAETVKPLLPRGGGLVYIHGGTVPMREPGGRRGRLWRHFKGHARRALGKDGQNDSCESH
jgi:hypothetical protein